LPLPHSPLKIAIMNYKWRGLIAFLLVAVLILGGLGWATRQALHVETHQQLAAANAQASEQLFIAQKERADRLRAALWRLDSRLTPALSREESRPFPHYYPLHSPFPALNGNWSSSAAGQFYLPSPLLTAELPEWITLHFQIDSRGWTSPQVISEELQKMLRKQPIELALNNVSDDRCALLTSLGTDYPPKAIATRFRELGLIPGFEDKQNEKWNEFFGNLNTNKIAGRGGNNNNERTIGNPEPQLANGINGLQGIGNNTINPQQQQIDYASRAVIQNRARRDGQGAYLFDDNRMNYAIGDIAPGKGATFQVVDVQLGSMKAVWLPDAAKPQHLLLARGATVGGKPVFQGFVVDWIKLQGLLIDEVGDLFPEASFVSLPPGDPPHLDRAMTTLPVEFLPGEPDLPETPDPVDPQSLPGLGWTPLRIGLAFAWGSALFALVAVALGGWSLIDLSERRIRFVSAVTHELRTPLTTLRLYLDLLSSGMIKEEQQKQEYLNTLNSEADRLHRLIGNVLDFARLEKSKPNVNVQPVEAHGILDQLRRSWHERCAAAGKDLVIENTLEANRALATDPGLVEQIVGNLIDNAQKYSREATDPRIVVRTLAERDQIVFEVEDRGPGVNQRERRRIFSPFQRGDEADTKAGGVGLGLALATRWAGYLNGQLDVRPGDGNVGACFRLRLPA
jgi:signal transduction histidine kinase